MDGKEPGQRGRPSKGERCLVAARLPRPLADAAKRLAAERGTTINDLIGDVLAAEIGTTDTTRSAQ